MLRMRSFPVNGCRPHLLCFPSAPSHHVDQEYALSFKCSVYKPVPPNHPSSMVFFFAFTPISHPPSGIDYGCISLILSVASVGMSFISSIPHGQLNKSKYMHPPSSSPALQNHLSKLKTVKFVSLEVEGGWIWFGKFLHRVCPLVSKEKSSKRLFYRTGMCPGLSGSANFHFDSMKQNQNSLIQKRQNIIFFLSSTSEPMHFISPFSMKKVKYLHMEHISV